MIETIYQTYTRTICSMCKNKDKCEEELRRKTDGTIKCDKYDTTFVSNRVDRITHRMVWQE